MPPSGNAPTRADWTHRLFPGEASPSDVTVLELEAVGERITAHPAVQRWLREAGFEAARGLRQADAMAEAQAHGRMTRDLKEQFRALVEAVRDATGGCAELALQWRPLQPNYSKVYLAFGDPDPDVFCALASPALSSAKNALRAVAGALPKGEPFPRRPNTATGVVEHDGRCLGVRYLERADDDEERRRSVVLLPSGEATDEHPEEEAARGIVAYFAPTERERWYER